jgi:hypothetical protein
MAPPLVRPPAAGLAFRAFDRPLHPELVAPLAARRADWAGGRLTVTLTPAGHLLTWAGGGQTVCDLTVAAADELPAAGRRLGWDVVAGERRGRFAAGPVSYQVGVSLEYLPPEVFAHLHAELAADASRRGFVAHLRPHHRLGLAPLGYVTADPVPRGVRVAAFHTFPDDWAVLKVQTLVELADAG